MLIDWKAVIATLPTPRYRRSFFIDARANPDAFDGIEQFVTLLRQIDPDMARELRGASSSAHYLAVLNYCADRFPINDAFVYDLEEEGYCDFIPVDSLGFDPWEDGISSPAVAACIVAHRTDDFNGGVFGVNDFECLVRFVGADGLVFRSTRIEPKSIKPPKGRTWRKPWDGLRDLYEYANSRTGYNFLDISNSEVGETYEYPQWDAAEVRALVRSWQGAKPVYDRAVRLMKYIDAKPRERLMQLANALERGVNTLHQLTVPLKPTRRSGR